jgi:sugar phosphate isomerase/epimerase
MTQALERPNSSKRNSKTSEIAPESAPKSVSQGVSQSVSGVAWEAPLLGIALPLALLEKHQGWLLEEGGRDLELQDPAQSDFLDGEWKPYVQKAAKLLGQHRGRLGIHAPYDGLTLLTQDAVLRRFVQMRLLKALEFAADLGATHMVIHSPFYCFGHPQVAHSSSTGLKQEIERIEMALEALLPLAEQVGCTLVMENIADRSVLPLLELVRKVNSKWLQLSLDTGHAHVTSFYGGFSPDEWLRQMGSQMAHIHLQDNDGLADRHWSPGRGTIHWPAFFAALRQLEHNPRLILEVTHSEIDQAKKWLLEREFVR